MEERHHKALIHHDHRNQTGECTNNACRCGQPYQYGLTLFALLSSHGCAKLSDTFRSKVDFAGVGLPLCPNSSFFSQPNLRRGSVARGVVRLQWIMRLAKDQIRQHRAVLEQWQKPSAMLDRARRLMELVGDADLFNQPGIDFVTEAWAAAQFARGRHVLAVRLVSARDEWPDFEVRTRRRKVERWEFTEVDDPRRRRGREMRQMAARHAAGKSAAKSVPMDRLINQAARVPGWIRARCREKAAKHYSSRVGLLIYLNWSEFGARHAEIETGLLAATASARNSFSEIWVLWKTRLYRTWSGGMAAELVKPAPETWDRLPSHAVLVRPPSR